MATLASLNPATGAVVGTVETTAPSDIGLFVHRARAAQRRWGAIPLAERAAMLRPAAEILRREAARIGAIVTAEMGKPLPEGTGEATYCADSTAAELDEIVDAGAASGAGGAAPGGGMPPAVAARIRAARAAGGNGPRT